MVLDRTGSIMSRPVFTIVSSVDTFSEHVEPVLMRVGTSTSFRYKLKARRLIGRRSLDCTLNLGCGRRERDLGMTSIDRWADKPKGGLLFGAS